MALQGINNFAMLQEMLLLIMKKYVILAVSHSQRDLEYSMVYNTEEHVMIIYPWFQQHTGICKPQYFINQVHNRCLILKKNTMV